MAITRLLFVDTNIWLDFYRARTDAGLRLLAHLEAVSDKLIVTYQVESEFKSNRQRAILEGIKELKAPDRIHRPALLSDAQTAKMLTKGLADADKRVKDMKKKMVRALKNPAQHDPVYQACQRMFHQESPLVLTREDDRKKRIRTKAMRRFLHGCPPRKRNDTSIGDAFNWEWMVQCAIEGKAELTIVSRDSDYGLTFEGVSYPNDHLRHEFSERVSKKRKLLLYSRLSDALKHFEVPVTTQEEEEEDELVASSSKRNELSIEQLITDLLVEDRDRARKRGDDDLED